jgi:hypothetical protein
MSGNDGSVGVEVIAKADGLAEEPNRRQDMILPSSLHPPATFSSAPVIGPSGSG